MTITYVDGTIDTDIAVGMKGISNIAKTSTVGNVDTYTITFTNGSTFSYTITNGVPGTDTEAFHPTDDTEATLDDADTFPFYDVSADAPKETLWSNIKAKLKSYFDGLYLGGAYKTTTTKTSSSGTDTFTLSDASITSSTVVYGVVCDKPMVNYTGITVSTGQIQITYNTSDAVGTVGFMLR